MRWCVDAVAGVSAGIGPWLVGVARSRPFSKGEGSDRDPRLAKFGKGRLGLGVEPVAETGIWGDREGLTLVAVGGAVVAVGMERDVVGEGGREGRR